MKLSRRHFLALSAASVGGVLLSRWVVGQNQPSQAVVFSPNLYKSKDGLLELDLEAGNHSLLVGDRQAQLLSFNGQFPAPRLEVKPGDTVRIHFTNKLSQPTNLHYHGLHITPTGNADNVFLSIPPNERLTYEFTYQGSTDSLPLPKTLADVEVLPEPNQIRRIELSMAMGMGSDMAFLFNGKTFDPQRVDADVKLGTVEDWELVNVDPDRMDHPFHLHVNSFQVISRNGQPEPYRAWKDTVLVKGAETVRIRIPFRDFVGKTVYHCHILDHEDLGMMGNVEIRA